MNRRILFIFLSLLISTLSARSQVAFDCDTIRMLWEQKEFTQMRAGFAQLAAKPALTAKETAALAFSDYLFRGDLVSAKTRLEALSAKYVASKAQFPEGFDHTLAMVLKEVNQEIQLHTARGTTHEQVKASANPEALRDAWGDDSPPAIDLIASAPSIPM